MTKLHDDLHEAYARRLAYASDPQDWDELTDEQREGAVVSAELVLDAIEAAGLAVVDLHPDRAHSPERTEHTADVWAECLRVLAYAGEKPGGLVWPGTVYRLMGEFRVGGDRLGELAGRLQTFLARELDGGRLRRDGGGDVDPDVAQALDGLDELRAAAVALYNAATRTQNALSHVAGVE